MKEWPENSSIIPRFVQDGSVRHAHLRAGRHLRAARIYSLLSVRDASRVHRRSKYIALVYMRSRGTLSAFSQMRSAQSSVPLRAVISPQISVLSDPHCR